MKVLVLGAGVVGVTSAWYLAEGGSARALADLVSGRRPEVSFGFQN